VGGEKSAGKSQADIMAFVATNVASDIIPSSGHWIMEENPAATVAMMTHFLSN
jgi:pimeloyl-ACP methyl ester carboxylesterase